MKLKTILVTATTCILLYAASGQASSMKIKYNIQKDHYPPAQINCYCYGLENYCDIPTSALPYIIIHGFSGNFTKYQFDHGVAESFFHYAPMFYYKNSSHGHDSYVSFQSSYGGIIADMQNPNWQLKNDGNYYCYAGADGCPFTNVPY